MKLGDIMKHFKAKNPPVCKDNAVRKAIDTQSINNFSIGQALGQGAYAIVKMAVHKPTMVQLALKTYSKSLFVSNHHRMNVMREIKVLERLNHKNIVKILYKINTPSELHLAMELVSGKDLLSYLKSQKNQRIPEVEFKKLFLQILKAVDHCHSMNVTHRDIKLENLLINEKAEIKLIDFGFSTIDNDPSRVFCGTPNYMAPEIVAKSECSGPPTDVWALGVLMHVLLTGSFPFKGSNEDELFLRIQVGNYLIHPDLPSKARSIVEKMLKVDPRDRPTVREVLKEKYFSMNEKGSIDPNQNEGFDASILKSMVRYTQNKYGFANSRLFQDLKNKNSRAYKLYRYLSFNNKNN